MEQYLPYTDGGSLWVLIFFFMFSLLPIVLDTERYMKGKLITAFPAPG